MAAFMDFSDDDEDDDRRRVKIYNIRDNPLDYMDDAELRRHYRFSGDGIREIVRIVGDDVRRATNRGGAIPTELQVLATLHYLGGNSLQLH